MSLSNEIKQFLKHNGCKHLNQNDIVVEANVTVETIETFCHDCDTITNIRTEC